MSFLDDFVPFILAAGAFLVPVLSSVHIISTKNDVRAAIGWVGVVWMVPFFGAVFYLLFGINRIQRRAARVRPCRIRAPGTACRDTAAGLSRFLPATDPGMVAEAELMDRIGRFPLTGGNHVTPYLNGEEAYPAMLEAIAGAEASIALSTYIFDSDEAGMEFIEALSRAQKRGVKVRVLIDAVGSLYSSPRSIGILREHTIPVAEFNTSSLPWKMPYLNLRNHRKLLIIDGKAGYTGGMNIRAGHYAERAGSSAIQDLHFRIRGPLTAHLMAVFAEDWLFTDGETLTGSAWFPDQGEMAEDGGTVARAIPDGPDADMDKIKWAILSALGMAKRSVRIITPYFIPDMILIAALNHAALRGVAVSIVLPEKNNLRFVQWASLRQYSLLLKNGVKIFHSPPPFDHSKLMTVDGAWALFGSANWDARSLRLNFELNVECFDDALVHSLEMLADRKITAACPVTLSDMNARPFYKKLRDGIVWLLSPYL